MDVLWTTNPCPVNIRRLRRASVFDALRGAVYGGQAQLIAQDMLDDKRLDSIALWIGLETYYDTALNRANVVLFDIRRLLNIRLDPDTEAT